MKIKDTPKTLLQGKPWTPSHSTNVQDTWKKHGWSPANPTPPAGNDPSYQQKGTMG